MDKAVMAETGGRIVSLALVLLAVYLKSGFIWVVAAGIASTFFNYLFNLFFSFRFSKFGYSFNWSEMKEIFRESLPIGVITILSLIYFKIDTVLLSLFKPSVDVGIYGTAYKILEILMALPGMFVGSIFPALSEAFSRENFERLIVIMQKSFDALSVASFGIGAFFFGLAKPTINLVAGKDYIQTSTINFAGYAITSDKVLQILIIAVVFSFWSNLFTNSLITFKKQKELIKPYIAATIFNVSANLILIPKFSYLATAIITVLTELIILIYTYILVKKLAQINLKLSVFLKCSFAGFLVLVVTYLGKEANFYIMILVSATIYLLTLIGLKVISRETVKGLIRR